DIVISFYQKIDRDYLFTSSSNQSRSHGGSGIVGFYRVSPEVWITMTDANGTSFLLDDIIRICSTSKSLLVSFFLRKLYGV
ncbi:hypothetical protein KYX73_12970, partial [Enterococcus faecium]|nr:hypothetical protein [Enterococcus faecium]